MNLIDPSMNARQSRCWAALSQRVRAIPAA
jgi:hypothetical protein